jgi:hypothetical protein
MACPFTGSPGFFLAGWLRFECWDWPGRALLLAVPLILTILPVYSFDCMDGASSRWCNWYELHGGWFGVTETCGDFRRYGLGSD